MIRTIPPGVWPTMITPLRDDGSLDLEGLGALVDWYVDCGVAGLFAVCQSSEMFYLDLDERVALSRATVEAAAGRVPVIASGHVSDAMKDQIRELQAVAATGIDALILVNNRLAAADEDDAAWTARCNRLMDALPQDLALGFYECPHPYKRPFPTELLRWCAESGRFVAFKDTCRDAALIARRQQVVDGTPLAIYNANAATLLETLRAGIAGYSGVMANFHPELYVWLCRNWRTEPVRAERLQRFLGLASAVEGPHYPRNAKAYLRLAGLPLGTKTRREARELDAGDEVLMRQLFELSMEHAAELR